MGANQSTAGGPGPEAQLMSLLMGNYSLQMLATAVRMGVFDVLAKEPASANLVAERADTLPDPTYRLLRALTMLGALTELPDRRFALGSLGQLLRSDAPCSFAPLTLNNAAPWGAEVSWTLLHSMKTGQSGFRHRYGMSMFEWLSEHPEEERWFSEGMSTFSGVENGCILASYDFAAHARIVDVGGAHGALLKAILQAHPKCSGTLFDKPSVIERAATLVGEPFVGERCSLSAGDFFESVPGGGDLYLLKHVLHDWDDAQALRILQSVSAAMPRGAAVLIAEQGVAPPGVPNPGKLLDVVVLSLLGGRERTASELASLMDQAGLRFEREVPTPGPITLFVGSKS
jgi:O-methyltransferase domain/Dimerisation domain